MNTDVWARQTRYGLRAALLLTVIGLLSACSSGDSPSRESGALNIGKIVYFVDAPVSGLPYRIDGGELRRTGPGGAVDLGDGRTVTFVLGGLQASIDNPPQIFTPADIYPDERATSLVRLLMAIDDDGNPQNGIDLADEVVDAANAAGLSEADLIGAAFDTSASANFASANSSSGTVPSVSQAQAHLDQTIAAITSGDSDGDGIDDAQDACPTIAGGNGGCEESAPTSTPAATPSASPAPSATPASTPSSPPIIPPPPATPAATPAATPTSAPSATPTATSSLTPSPSSEPSSTPSTTPINTPSTTPETTPSSSPSASPSNMPSPSPSSSPSIAPSSTPTPSPSTSPSVAPSVTPTPVAAPSIHVLSNRSDLISGGNALIEVVAPEGLAPDALVMSLNGSDVTDAFATTEAGRFIALIEGLELGNNTFTASAGGDIASVTLRNHPQGGPLFAGPQLQPWTCRNSGAVDEQCNQAVEYSWFYLPEGEDALQPYDRENPPTDVASVTTETGVEVPFIVRRETGYQDRDQYKIAVLYQPDVEWSAQAPQPQFNGKLMITHGASCGVDYETGGAPKVISYNPLDFAGLDDPVTPHVTADSAVYALGRGFAVMSTALNNSGHNCDLPLQAESMVMAKEHLIEQYGSLRYTIGAGCSGGSLAAQWVANAYPGLYQGILPTCSFPDTWSTATQFVDYHGLLLYFFGPLIFTEEYQQWAPEQFTDNFDPADYPFQPTDERTEEGWTLQSIADVMGHVTVLNAHISEQAQFAVAVPDNKSGCGGVSNEQLYDPETNPGGVRCSIVDASINVFAPRPSEDWIAPEIANGKGFAGFPLDNVGVQYGLGALQDGKITVQQFIDLNRDIGGLDIDTRATVERTPASQPALRNAYRSGMINVTNNLDRTAIIDCRGPDPGLFHDAYRTFALRERLVEQHGNHDNHVIWGGPTPIIGDASCALNSFQVMDDWLAATEADDSELPIAEKLTANKPGAAVDSCWDGTGQSPAPAPVACPEAVLTVYGTPRMVAGDSIATYTNKCQLKPVEEADYSVGGLGIVPLLVPGQLEEIQAIFPDGVCDYTKPGVDFQGTIPWMTYSDSVGGVIYGGEPLPTPPENSGAGWMHENFGGF